MNIRKISGLILFATILSCAQMPNNLNTNQEIKKENKPLPYNIKQFLPEGFDYLSPDTLVNSKTGAKYSFYDMSLGTWNYFDNIQSGGNGVYLKGIAPSTILDDSGKYGNSYSTLLQYSGLWYLINDANSEQGAYIQAELVENDNASLIYLPQKWNVIKDDNATGGSYSYLESIPTSSFTTLSTSSNSSSNYLLVAEAGKGTPNLSYIDGKRNWIHKKDNDDAISYNSSAPIMIKPNSKSITKKGNDWNYSDETLTCTNKNNTSMEIAFNGSNIEIWGKQGKKYGIVRVTIFDSYGNIEKIIDNIDRYSSKNKISVIAKIQGLKQGSHTAKIEPTQSKNSASSGYTFDYIYSLIFPSAEFIFSGNNIQYFAWLSERYGKVDVILDGGTPERIDLYNPNKEKYRENDDEGYDPLYYKQKEKSFKTSSDDSDDDEKSHNSSEYIEQQKPVIKMIKEFQNLDSSQHRITLESTCDKNQLSKGYTITLNKFTIKSDTATNPLPSVTPTALPTSFPTINPTPNPTPIPTAVITTLPSIVPTPIPTFTPIPTPVPTPIINIVPPSIEIPFIGNEAILRVVKGPNLGMADLYVNGSNIGTIDLYSPNKVYQNIILSLYNGFTIQNQNENTYKFKIENCLSLYCSNNNVVIKAKNIKNPLSTGFGITFDSIDYSFVAVNRSGIYEYFAAKGPDMGLVDIYINDQFKQSVDLYSPTKLSRQSVFIIKASDKNNLFSGFKIRPSGKKNPASSGYKINFDALRSGISNFGGLSWWPSYFSGTGIEYKGVKGPDMGITSVSLNNKEYLVDLYSPTIQYNQTLLTIKDLPYAGYKLFIEATDDKNPASTGYNTSISLLNPFSNRVKGRVDMGVIVPN